MDAGLDPNALRKELKKLGLAEFDVAFHPTSRGAISATSAQVQTQGRPVPGDGENHLSLQEHSHYHLSNVLSVIRKSDLDLEVKELAVEIFQRLATAEAAVHGTTVEEVHLHEVGAADAIIDIVGVLVGLRLLDVQEVYSSPLRFGTGYVDCAHGRYPVPVPGVLELCKGVPSEQTNIQAELVTPTGAAIITTLAKSFGPSPSMRLQCVGYGAGARDLEEVPNLLRIRLGDRVSDRVRDDGGWVSGLETDRSILVEANIDDMNPEVYTYLFDRLQEEGAKEVYVTPVHMKKGRPGNLLSVLIDEEHFDGIVATILAETTTLGVRYHGVDRRKLARRMETVTTPYGDVRVKVCEYESVKRQAPEYEDCARLAKKHGIPIQAVYEAARGPSNPPAVPSSDKDSGASKQPLTTQA